jgi:hypothetical protein
VILAHEHYSHAFALAVSDLAFYLMTVSVFETLQSMAKIFKQLQDNTGCLQ